jgi:hypothetical protein
MENVGIFYAILQYMYITAIWSIFPAIWSIFRPFGICTYFPRFGILCQEKSGKPTAPKCTGQRLYQA